MAAGRAAGERARSCPHRRLPGGRPEPLDRDLGVPGVELLRCRGVEVELLDEAAADRFALDVDGEPLGRLPLRAELVPGALAMPAPERAVAPEA